jgi:hypothetical protein
MSELESHNGENQLWENGVEDDESIRHGSDSTIVKPFGVARMSARHETALIITIFMA